MPPEHTHTDLQSLLRLLQEILEVRLHALLPLVPVLLLLSAPLLTVPVCCVHGHYPRDQEPLNDGLFRWAHNCFHCYRDTSRDLQGHGAWLGIWVSCMLLLLLLLLCRCTTCC
jgi:hypothetical protein